MTSITIEPQLKTPTPVVSHQTPFIEWLWRSSGLLFALCMFGAGNVAPDPPAHWSPDQELSNHYSQYYQGIMLSVFLWGVSSMFFLLFLSGLHQAVCKRKHFLKTLSLFMLASGITATALIMVAQATMGAGAVLAHKGRAAELVRICDEVPHIIAHLWALPAGICLLVASIAQYSSRLVPRWIAIMGMAAGFAAAATTSWLFVGISWMHNVGVLALLLFMVWGIASSISLLWRVRKG